MTMLSELVPGDAFILLARLASADAVTGMVLSFYGPTGAQQGTIIVDPQGQFTGQLQIPPEDIPVTLVPSFNTVSVGDILMSGATGETWVARWVGLAADGTYRWSSQISGENVNTLDIWHVIGHTTL